MHELSITQEIIRIAERGCLDHGGTRVLMIQLVIGEDSGFVGDSIQMYFDVISQGTLCEGSRISIQRVPSQIECYVDSLEIELSDETISSGGQLR